MDEAKEQCTKCWAWVIPESMKHHRCPEFLKMLVLRAGGGDG